MNGLSAVHSGLLVFLLILILSSCTAGRKSQSAQNLNRNKSLTAVMEKQLEWKRLSVRAKAEYRDDLQEQNFGMQIRLVRDSIIWVSLSGPLNMEVARVLIDTDSIRILDRLSKQYVVKEIGFLSQLAQAEINFRQLQQLIGADFLRAEMFLASGTSINTVGTVTELSYTENAKTECRLSVQLDSLQVNKYVASSLDKSSTLEMELSDYRAISSDQFAFYRKLQFRQALKKASMDLSFTKIEIDPLIELPFKVDDKYERIR